MQPNNVTVEQALQGLDSATQPAAQGKLTRTDYVNIQLFLQVLAEFVEKHSKAEKKEDDKVVGGAFGKPSK